MDNTIFLTFLHSTGRTCLHTPWILTVKTWHEDETHSGISFDVHRTESYYFTGDWSQTKLFVCLAVNFARLAGYAVQFVMFKNIFTHFLPPPAVADFTLTIVS